jgi:hypothetical protein
MPQNERTVFYQLYFQGPGIAVAEFEKDPRDTLRKLLYWASGDSGRSPQPIGSGVEGMVPRDGGFLTGLTAPPSLPSWLTEADVDYYAGEFERTVFAAD